MTTTITTHRVSFLFNLVQSCSILFHLVQSCSILFNLVPSHQWAVANPAPAPRREIRRPLPWGGVRRHQQRVRLLRLRDRAQFVVLFWGSDSVVFERTTAFGYVGTTCLGTIFFDQWPGLFVAMLACGHACFLTMFLFDHACFLTMFLFDHACL